MAKNIYSEIKNHLGDRLKLFEEILSNRTLDYAIMDELWITYKILLTDLNTISFNKAYKYHKYLLKCFNGIIDIRFLIYATNGNIMANTEFYELLAGYNIDEFNNYYNIEISKLTPNTLVWFLLTKQTSYDILKNLIHNVFNDVYFRVYKFKYEIAYHIANRTNEDIDELLKELLRTKNKICLDLLPEYSKRINELQQGCIIMPDKQIIKLHKMHTNDSFKTIITMMKLIFCMFLIAILIIIIQNRMK